MTMFAGIPFTLLEIALSIMLMLLAVTTILTMRRLSSVEDRLQRLQLTTAREIKMVNQGAIGIGRRFAVIEKNLKKSANVASFEAAKETRRAASSFQKVVSAMQPEVDSTPDRHKPVRATSSTRAEQALSAWINDHQSA